MDTCSTWSIYNTEKDKQFFGHALRGKYVLGYSSYAEPTF
jgi:hypothetical protein